jgi:hypothetical protein
VKLMYLILRDLFSLFRRWREREREREREISSFPYNMCLCVCPHSLSTPRCLKYGSGQVNDEVHMAVLPFSIFPFLNLGSDQIRSGLPDLDHMSHRLSADRADFHLLGALDAGAHVAAVVEERVHALTVTDLTHFSLLVGYLPVGRSLAPALAFLVSANVLVARPFLHKDTLTVSLILRPASHICVAVGVDATTLDVFLGGGPLSG